MALTVIALGIAAVALVGCIYLFFRVAALSAEVERKGWEIKGIEATVAALKKEDKEISVAGLEGVSYDPKTTTMTIDGNLVVKGGVAAGGIIKED